MLVSTETSMAVFPDASRLSAISYIISAYGCFLASCYSIYAVYLFPKYAAFIIGVTSPRNTSPSSLFMNMLCSKIALAPWLRHKLAVTYVVIPISFKCPHIYCAKSLCVSNSFNASVTMASFPVSTAIAMACDPADNLYRVYDENAGAGIDTSYYVIYDPSRGNKNLKTSSFPW